MRNIKFRAWDKAVKDMVPIKTIDFRKDGAECAVDFCDINGDLTGKNPEWVLMQYTGMKDKNGREIFEGDILKCRRYEFVKVIWGDDGFKAWYQPSSVNITVISLNHFLQKNKSTKIIGNIYENPELLEESE